MAAKRHSAALKARLTDSMLRYLEGRAAHYEVDERAGCALASLVYDDALSEVPGYDLLDARDTAFDYQALALLHRKSKTLVIANRGTEGFRKWDDWEENFRLARGDGSGQMREAVSFAADVIQSTPRSRFNKVVCVGHSLGAGLAEAQVALVPAVLAQRNKPGVTVEGIGTGSAGFRDTIIALGDLLQLALERDRVFKMSHYVRKADPICDSPGWRHFTELTVPPSVHEPMLDTSQAGGRPPKPHMIDANPFTNHSSALYFALYGAEGAHIFAYRNGSYAIRSRRMGPAHFMGIHEDWKKPKLGVIAYWPEAASGDTDDD